MIKKIGKIVNNNNDDLAFKTYLREYYLLSKSFKYQYDCFDSSIQLN